MVGVYRRTRKLSLFLPIAAILLVSLATPASAGTSIQSLRNLNSWKCMDNQGSTTAGAQIAQWDCVGSSEQLWNIIPSQPVWIIQNQYSGQCLDVYQGRYQNGTKVVQWPCNTGDSAQRFNVVLRGTSSCNADIYLITPWAANFKYVVEVSGQSKNNGAPIDLWADWGGGNQRWTPC